MISALMGNVTRPISCMPGAQMPEGEYWTGEGDLFEFMFYCLIFWAVGVQRTASNKQQPSHHSLS
jgi:hypothetical protein